MGAFLRSKVWWCLKPRMLILPVGNTSLHYAKTYLAQTPWFTNICFPQPRFPEWWHSSCSIAKRPKLWCHCCPKPKSLTTKISAEHLGPQTSRCDAVRLCVLLYCRWCPPFVLEMTWLGSRTPSTASRRGLRIVTRVVGWLDRDIVGWVSRFENRVVKVLTNCIMICIQSTCNLNQINYVGSDYRLPKKRIKHGLIDMLRHYMSFKLGPPSVSNGSNWGESIAALVYVEISSQLLR